MPTYRFKDTETGEIFEKFLYISELDKYLEENKKIKQLVGGAPLISSGRGMSKPDEGFRDILREMKKKNSKGITRSSINTF